MNKNLSLRILHVVGARPNFMKAAPVMRALASYPAISQKLVHTGQHYDANMSDIFFRQLGLPEPDFNLEVGSGSHANQTAQIMMRFEEVVLRDGPNLVLVYGDVNSTVAAALVCAKLGIPVGHVEAGLRSFDRTMPEEINRLLTDQIADLLFTPSTDGDQNLLKEGVAPEKIHFVGNVMIDTLVRLIPQVPDNPNFPDLKIKPQKYGLVTLHRPSNVDDLDMLRAILVTIQRLSQDLDLIFPIHPRTRAHLQDWDLISGNNGRLSFCDPIGYLEFLSLQKYAALVITDSGGIQEETTFLGVPCLTLRNNTERPITITLGTNVLIGQDMGRLEQEVQLILAGKGKQGSVPPLWDGRAGERIGEIIVKLDRK
jgi:UDP-N-acetylglucosamine 2-epimerase (non-hydrolysing)